MHLRLLFILIVPLKSIYHQYYYDAYHEYDGFRKDYRDTYGREAYVGPLVKYRLLVLLLDEWHE